MSKEAPRPEVREVPSRVKYPVPVVRIMAGMSPEDVVKPISEVSLEKHKERLKTITAGDLDHSHVVDISTQERLVRSKIEGRTPEAIAVANREWAKKVVEWLRKEPQSVADAVKRVYGIDKAADAEKVIGDLEYLREQAFDGDDKEHVAGELDVKGIVFDFTHGQDPETREVFALDFEEVQRDLEDIEPFLYIFGGEKTVARLKDAILATAALENAPIEERNPDDPQRTRDDLIGEVEPLLLQELSDEEREYYLPGVGGVANNVKADVAREGSLLSDAAQGEQEGSGALGAHHFDTTGRRSGPFAESSASAEKDGGKPGGEGGAPKAEVKRIVLSPEDFRVREFVPLGPSQSDKLEEMNQLVTAELRLQDVRNWYQLRVDTEKRATWLEGEIGGKGQWKARIMAEEGPKNEDIKEMLGEVPFGSFTLVAYTDNREKTSGGKDPAKYTTRYMIEVDNPEGGKDRLRVEGEGFEGAFKVVGIEGPAYNQALVEENGRELVLPDGKKEVVTGFVGVILHKGRVLLFTKKSNGVDYVEARGAQLSLDHYENLFKGELPVVGEMAALFKTLYGDNPQQFIEDLRTGRPSFSSQTGKISYGSLSMYNSDRATANNKRFIIDLGEAQDELADQLAANGGRWCTAEEVEALDASGILNALGAAALLPLVRKLETFDKAE